MSWTLRIRLLGGDQPKIFNSADDGLVTFYQAGHPEEYTARTRS
jgi:hypothetical protein